MQKPIFAIVCVLMMTAQAIMAGPRVQPIDLTKHTPADKLSIQLVENGSYEWDLPEGQPQTLQINLDKLGINPADYDELRFDLKPMGSQVTFSIKLTAFPTVNDVSSWYLKSKTITGEWNDVRYDLHKDDDGALLKHTVKNTEQAHLLSIMLDRRIIGFPGEPNWRMAQFRNIRFVKHLVSVDFDLLATRIEENDKEVGYVYTLSVTNHTDKALQARLDADSAHTLKNFRAEAPSEVALKPRERVVVPIRISMPRAQATTLPALYSEPAYPRVSVNSEMDSDVVPLMGYRKRAMWAAVPVFNRTNWIPSAIQEAVKTWRTRAPGIEAWQAKMVSTADIALATNWPTPPVDLMPPGYDQSYLCEKCGGFLRPVEPTNFRRHTCPKCHAMVEGNQWINRCYVSWYLASRCDDIRALAMAWLLTSKDAYADKAVEILLAFAKAYPTFPVPGDRSTAGQSRLSFATLHSAYQLPKLAEAYMLLQKAPCLDTEKKKAVERMLLEEAFRVSCHGTEFNNQGSEHGRAFGSVGLATGFWPLTAQAIHGEFGWHDLAENTFSDDGINHEGMDYHVGFFLCMNRFAAFAHQFGVNLLTERVKRVYDGSLTLGLGAPYSWCYELAYRVYREPAYLPAVKSTRNAPDEMTLFCGVPDLPDISKMAFSSVLMPTSGYIFLRRGTVADYREIRLNYIENFNRTERDRFSTSFFRNANRVDSAVGRITYGSPLAHWMFETAAHNAIVLDGVSQREIGARLLAFNPSNDAPIAVVTDDKTPLYEQVKQLRGIALVDDAYIVFDRISAASPHTIDRYQYGQGAATITPSGKVETLSFLPKLGQFTGLEGGTSGKEARVTFAGNQLSMRLIADHDMAYYKARTIGDYQAQPIEVTFARVEAAKEVTFLAGFCEGKDTELPTLAIQESRPEKLVFTVTVKGKTYRITVDAVAKSATVTPQS